MVMLGKPVIKGTRIAVEHIVQRVAEGWSREELIKSYPHIDAEQIAAALHYAAKSVGGDEFIFLAESA